MSARIQKNLIASALSLSLLASIGCSTTNPRTSHLANNIAPPKLGSAIKPFSAVQPQESSLKAFNEQAKQLQAETTASKTHRHARPIKILPLGDSITHGGGGYPSYRRSLWFMLKDSGYQVDFIGSHRDFIGYVPKHYIDFDLDHEGHWGELLSKVVFGSLIKRRPDCLLSPRFHL